MGLLPLTQNGCVRILSQSAYPNRLDITEAIHRLRALTSTPYHLFVADDVSLLDDAIVVGHSLLGPAQITDVYLLALAVSHRIRLVTLDRSVPLTTVREAGEESLIVL